MAISMRCIFTKQSLGRKTSNREASEDSRAPVHNNTTDTPCSLPGRTPPPPQRESLSNMECSLESESILEERRASAPTGTEGNLSRTDCKPPGCRHSDLFILIPSVFVTEPGLQWALCEHWGKNALRENEESVSLNLPANIRKAHSSKVIREALSQDFVLQAAKEMFLPGLLRADLEHTVRPHEAQWYGKWDIPYTNCVFCSAPNRCPLHSGPRKEICPRA